jgi:hypothetical protein
MRLALPVRLHITQDIAGEAITLPLLVHYYEDSAGGHHAGAHLHKDQINLYIVDNSIQITAPKQRICIDGRIVQSAGTNDIILVTDARGYESTQRCFTDIIPTKLTQVNDLQPFRSLTYRIELAHNTRRIKSYLFQLRELYIHYVGMTLHMTDAKSGVPFTMLFNELLHRASCGVRCKAVDRWSEHYDQITITDTGALRIDAAFKPVDRFIELLEFERKFEEARKR